MRPSAAEALSLKLTHISALAWQKASSTFTIAKLLYIHNNAGRTGTRYSQLTTAARPVCEHGSELSYLKPNAAGPFSNCFLRVRNITS